MLVLGAQGIQGALPSPRFILFVKRHFTLCVVGEIKEALPIHFHPQV